MQKINRFKTEDGRRAETRVSENILPDGQIEQVTEMMEEDLPLKLTKKVTRKMMTVPVEEKHEVFSADGTVETTVKTVNQNHLSLDAHPVTLDDIMNRLDALEMPSKKPSGNLKSMVNKSLNEPVSTVSQTDKMLTIGFWMLAAVMAALCICKVAGISLF